MTLSYRLNGEHDQKLSTKLPPAPIQMGTAQFDKFTLGDVDHKVPQEASI